MSQRVVTLLPSATEMVAQLAPEALRAVTYECDWPVWVRKLPKLVSPADPNLLEADPAEVDQRVGAALGHGSSLYRLDTKLLAEVAPDLVVTQRLCNVCTISGDEVARAVAELAKPPAVIELAPMTLVDVLDDVVRVGKAIERTTEAETWCAELEERIGRVRSLPPPEPRPRVLALEWPDPPWAGGHWIPEMIELAGGVALFGETGRPSTRVPPEAILASEPDLVLMMACGYDTRRNEMAMRTFAASPTWRTWLQARPRRWLAMDANALFSRSSPRLVEGLELLARIFRHESVDERFAQEMSSAAWIGNPAALGI